MPDLLHSLQGRDLGHLRVVSDLWGKPLNAPDARVGMRRLAALILDPELVGEVIRALPERARMAVDELIHNDGRLPWPVFERRFGTIREMGTARRERERPYSGLNASASEALWYRAIIARDFFDTPHGPEEFAYIPDDLLAFIPKSQAERNLSMGRPATPREKAWISSIGDTILDDACTLLAALRTRSADRGDSLRAGIADHNQNVHFRLVNNTRLPYPLTIDLLQTLLIAAGLVSGDGNPNTESVRHFLEAGRGDALLTLVQAWIKSMEFNDLRLMPGIMVEGEWKNDPTRARRAIIDFLSTVPGARDESIDPSERPFWSLVSLIGAVRQAAPDFQRSAGEYDTWYLRSADSGEYLRGFEHWNEVEGALIRFVIGGPLHWLGIVDLGLPDEPDSVLIVDRESPHESNSELDENRRSEPSKISAFRFTPWAADLLNFRAPRRWAEEGDKFFAGSDGSLKLPRSTRRDLRYQVARFARCDRFHQDHYVYRLTPASLSAAQKAGLRITQLLTLLRKHAPPVPPSLVQALERWESSGSTGRVDRLIVLRVKDPAVLQALRSSKVGRFFGEPLGPTAVIVRVDVLDKVMSGLTELGYLFDNFAGEIKEMPE